MLWGHNAKEVQRKIGRQAFLIKGTIAADETQVLTLCFTNLLLRYQALAVRRLSLVNLFSRAVKAKRETNFEAS